MKNKKGKWTVTELKVRWFCRVCGQKGIAGLTILPEKEFWRDVESAIKTVTSACHTGCPTPDIRTIYDAQQIR